MQSKKLIPASRVELQWGDSFNPPECTINPPYSSLVYHSLIPPQQLGHQARDLLFIHLSTERHPIDTLSIDIL